MSQKISKPHTVLQNNFQLYIANTSHGVDLNDIKSYRNLIKMIIVPICITALVVIVPLGGLTSNTIVNDDDNQSEVIDKWAYVVFQIVYCTIAYYSIFQPINIALQGYLYKLVSFLILPYIVGVLGE